VKLHVTEASDYEGCPEGLHLAKIIWVLDLGLQTTPFGVKPQVFINFEVNERQENGKLFTIGKFYTASLNEKANLTKDLSSLRGKKLQPGEEVDLQKLLGMFCHINVLNNDKGKPQVTAIMPAKGQRFEGEAEILTEEDSLLLPDWFQELLAKAIPPEPVGAAAPSRKAGGMSDLALENELNDEVPF
jgi:hypothetical protein